MSLKKFALAVGASRKWVLNAKPRLGRPIDYTPADARWLRIAHVLNRELRIPLPFAAKLAVDALASPFRTPALVVAKTEGIRLTVDLRRQRSTFASVLESAEKLGNNRRPGRKRRPPAHAGAAIVRAWRLRLNLSLLRSHTRNIQLMPNHRILLDRLAANRVRFVVVGELAESLAGARVESGRPVFEICYPPTQANMKRLVAAFRGTAEFPPTLDVVTLRSTNALVFDTTYGPVTLHRDLPGVGGFAEVSRRSGVARVLGADVRALDIATLAHVRTASGTNADIARLPVLETLLALPSFDARRREVAARRPRWTGN